MSAQKPQMCLLSQDGPMGFNKLYFAQIVFGCAGTHPQSAGSAAVLASFARSVQSRGGSGDGGLGKETADYVQSIIDGKVDDAIAREYFTDARVIENPAGSEEPYDFSLNLDAVEQCIKTHQLEVSQRFVHAMCNATGGLGSVMDLLAKKDDEQAGANENENKEESDEESNSAGNGETKNIETKKRVHDKSEKEECDGSVEEKQEEEGEKGDAPEQTSKKSKKDVEPLAQETAVDPNPAADEETAVGVEEEK